MKQTRPAAIAAFRRQQEQNRRAYFVRRKTLRISLVVTGFWQMRRQLRKIMKALKRLGEAAEAFRSRANVQSVEH